MHAGDYGESYSEPWTFRKRILPLRTYSGRVVYNRRKHLFGIRDVSRIMAKIEPETEEEEGGGWQARLIEILREATLNMLARLLPFLEGDIIEDLYDFAIRLMDTMFQVFQSDENKRFYGVKAIQEIAARAAIDVTIKPKG